MAGVGSASRRRVRPGSLLVERIAILADLGAGGEARQDWHLPGDRLAKRIDGTHLQTGGVFENSPTALTVAPKNRGG